MLADALAVQLQASDTVKDQLYSALTSQSQIQTNINPADINEYQQLVRSKPLTYVSKCLGITLHPKQIPIMRAVASHPRVSVRSGNGVGKTYLTAAISCWYLDGHCPGYVVCTGATWQGLTKTVMPTLRRVVVHAPTHLGGRLLSTEWRRADQWGFFMVSPDEPENISGFRTSGGVLVIVDEASSLDRRTYEAIMGLCSGLDSKVVMLGNPLRPEGPFFDTFGNPDWVNFHINSEDVVDFQIPGLATRDWIAARKREWGEDSPAYIARVKGDFPTSSEDTTIPRLWADVFAVSEDPEPKGQLRMGVDVARYGMDRTVFLIRDDSHILHLEYKTKINTMEVCGFIVQLKKKHKIEDSYIFVDDCGVGGGVVDRLLELDVACTPVNNGRAADDPNRFANARAETYWRMREALRPDPDSRFHINRLYADLLSEITMPKYSFTSKGQIILESKDEIKARLLRSPDMADALALTWASPGEFGIKFV